MTKKINVQVTRKEMQMMSTYVKKGLLSFLIWKMQTNITENANFALVRGTSQALTMSSTEAEGTWQVLRFIGERLT